MAHAIVAALFGDEPAVPPFRSPADIPVDFFFRSSALLNPQLNAAGTHLAVLAHDPKADANSIVVVDLAQNAITAARSNAELNIRSFQWADDETLVFSVVKDRLYAGGLYAAHRSNPTKFTIIDPFDVLTVLGVPRARPKNLKIWVHDGGDGVDRGISEVEVPRDKARLNPRIRVQERIAIPSGYDGVHRWLLDQDGELRYAVAYVGVDLFLLRYIGPKNWTRVDIDLDIDYPLAVDTDHHLIFVAHRNSSGNCDLVRFNTADGSRGPVLHSDAKYDFSDAAVIVSRDDEVRGIVYARQALQQLWLRDEDEALQREIDASLPGDHINLVVSRSRDEKRFIVHSGSDRHPGTIYLFDREQRTLKRMGELAPWLPQRLMAPVQLVTYRARDGLELEGYLTLPLGQASAKPEPMVVLPHGGPWTRDNWGYDAESQFLASRGYVVFRPNYRGSSGYRAEISALASMEFRKMHDDVTDGVRALIASKIADPKRIAIFGSSFGGYLAIAGAAFEPDLYRCAASFAGVFDVEALMKEDRANNHKFRLASFQRHLGDPKANRERFDAMSPLRHVQAIKAKIFVAHGVEDRNADAAQSRRLAKALKAAGVAHETMFISGEAHGLAAMKNRVEFFRRLEAFLKQNL